MNPTRCQNCCLDLPQAATGPLCDFCDGTPIRPTPAESTQRRTPLTVVHGGGHTSPAALSAEEFRRITEQRDAENRPPKRRSATKKKAGK